MLSCFSFRYGSLVDNKNPLLNEDILTLKPLGHSTEDKQWNFPENYTDIYLQDELEDATKYSFIPTISKVLCCFIGKCLKKVSVFAPKKLNMYI